jgi:hypothetical protein
LKSKTGCGLAGEGEFQEEAVGILSIEDIMTGI